MQPHLYAHTDYRKFLTVVLSERGKKKQLCDFIQCQTPFFSNVMAGGANLSLEHAIRVCNFLGFSEKERHYFMLLVQYGKAGSKELESYYLAQIELIQKEQEKISNHISSHETIPLQDQLMIYRSWLYVAIHILCAVSSYRTRKAIRYYLHLPSKEIDPIIDFLIEKGVLIEGQEGLKQGATRIHLPKGSPFLQKHHMNWRTKAIQSLDYDKENDLHYTMVMSLSKNDIDKMKQIILDSVKRTDQLLRETGDEIVYAFCVDWFQV